MENGDAASNIIISSSETKRSRRFFSNISLYSALAAAILLIITLSSPAFTHKAAPEELIIVQVSSLHVSNFSLSHFSHLITARFEVGFAMSSPDNDELMMNTDISRVSVVHGGLELASTSETRTEGKGSVVNVKAVMEAHKIWKKKEEEELIEEMEEDWKWKKMVVFDVKVQGIVVSFQDAKSPPKYNLFNLTCPNLPIFYGKRRDAGRLLGIGGVGHRCLND